MWGRAVGGSVIGHIQERHLRGCLEPLSNLGFYVGAVWRVLWQGGGRQENKGKDLKERGVWKSEPRKGGEREGHGKGKLGVGTVP